MSKEKHMYAVKIRKSDAKLLQLLNYGKEVPITTKKMYLVVHLENHVPNEILTEKQFSEKYEAAANPPVFLKLKKVRY